MSDAPAPRRVAVIGGGIVGLSAAWFLQEHGAHVTVIERNGDTGTGSSWGNAGWVSPAMVAPLPEPAVLRYGLRAVVSTASPVYVPLALDVGLASFLTRFVAHSTARRWERGPRALIPLARLALDGFDQLRAGGVGAATVEAKPLLAAFATNR